MIGMTEVLGDFGFANMVGLRFSSVAMSRPSGGNDSLAAHIVAAGTHDDPVNTVSVWSAELVQDPQFSDGLLSHEALGLDDARGPPPAPLRVLPASPPSPAARPRISTRCTARTLNSSAAGAGARRWMAACVRCSSGTALGWGTAQGCGQEQVPVPWPCCPSSGQAMTRPLQCTTSRRSGARRSVAVPARACMRFRRAPSRLVSWARLHAFDCVPDARVGACADESRLPCCDLRCMMRVWLQADAEGKLALSAGEDGAVFELRADAGGVQATRCGGACDWVALADVAFAEAGQAFFTAGTAGGVKMWDLNMPGQARAFSLAGDGTCAPATAVQSFGVHVIAGGEDGHVAIFDSRCAAAPAWPARRAAPSLTTRAAARRHERAPLTVHSAPAPAPGFHAGPVRSIRGCGPFALAAGSSTTASAPRRASARRR
jgi:hypothetical protein